MTIRVHHIQTAIDAVQAIVDQLPLVYATMAQSPVIGSFSTIQKIIEKAGVSISHTALYRKMRYRLDPIQFKLALDGLKQAGIIEVTYPDGNMTKPHYRRIK